MRSLLDKTLALPALTGIKRGIALFTLGALCVLLFAPFDAWPLLFILLPLFFLVLDSAYSRWRAAWDGFFFGYGYFMASTYWIAISMTVDAGRFGWMIPLCIFGLSAVFALWFLVFGAAYHLFKRKGRYSNLLIFSALWVLIEYARSLGTFGFPWNLIGYSLVPIPALLQFASLAGIYGMSLLAVMGALAVVPFVTPQASVQLKRFSTLVAVAFVAVYAYGVLRNPPVEPVAKPLHIRIVQAAIPQTAKWDSDEVGRIFYTYRVLSQTKSEIPPDIVIWPETAIPLTLTDESSWMEQMPRLLPPHAQLISGVVREQGADIYNSLAVFNDKGDITAQYRKRRLVPFGEFIPLRQILPLDKIAPGPRDFSFGTSGDSVNANGIPPFQPMICYEVIFPWLADSQNDQAKWLLTITNDAWFGNSPGPYQHMAMSRVRAVEQGLPLLRAANTGISAVVDPRGRIIHRLALNRQGVLDTELPPAFPPTLYREKGEFFVLLAILTICLLALRYRDAT